MTLLNLLTALSNNTNLSISLCDSKDNVLIIFNATGYTAIESDLGSRTVSKVKIIDSKSVSISIEDPATEPSNP